MNLRDRLWIPGTLGAFEWLLSRVTLETVSLFLQGAKQDAMQRARNESGALRAGYLFREVVVLLDAADLTCGFPKSVIRYFPSEA
jgi:hypothetical protein